MPLGAEGGAQSGHKGLSLGTVQVSKCAEAWHQRDSVCVHLEVTHERTV